MNIRKMTNDDYEKIHHLWSITNGISLRVLDDSKEGTSIFLKRNPNTNYICEIENELVGVILCGHDGRKGFIYHTVVKEEFRKRGIGKLLVEKVTDSLKEEGITKVAIVVYSDNDEGNRFWTKLNFIHLDDLDYRVLYLTDENRLINK